MARPKSKSRSRAPLKPRKATKSSPRLDSASQLPDHNQAGAGELGHRGKLLSQHLPSTGSDRARVLERAQPFLLGEMVYIELAQRLMGGKEFVEIAGPGALSFLEEMQPRSALERLALTQALLAHARAAWLTKLLTTQTDPHCFGTVAEACERAVATLTRLMRALMECRQPKSPSTTVSIGQANVAREQVVQNVRKQEGTQRENDEQTRNNERGRVIGAQAVPVVEKRAEVTESRNPGNATMGEKHGTKKSGR
jgi:hypothetical protein